MLTISAVVDVEILDIDQIATRACSALATVLRSTGLNVGVLHEPSLKKALRFLDKSGTLVGLIVGEREMQAGVVRVVETWSAGWKQHTIPAAEILDHYLLR